VLQADFAILRGPDPASEEDVDEGVTRLQVTRNTPFLAFRNEPIPPVRRY